MGEHPLAGWLEGADEQDPRDDQAVPEEPAPGSGQKHRRLRVVIGLAAIPWLLVAVTFALGRGGGEDQDAAPAVDLHGQVPTGDDAEAPDGDEADGAPATDGAHGATPFTQTSPGDLTAAAPVTASGLPPALAAAATTGLRLAASDLSGEGDGVRYVDHAVAEDVEWVADVAVVQVRAIVLHGDREGWTGSDVQRFAVPVTAAASGEHTVAGAPWRLPDPPRDDPAPRDWQPLEAVPEGVETALGEAGFPSPDVLEVAVDPATGLHRAQFTTDGQPTRHDVWLVTDPRPRVLGIPAHH
jgi:hypothetical protein